LESTPNNAVYLCTYADFLAYHDHNFADAEKFYQQSIALEEHSHAYNNYGCVLVKRTQVEAARTPKWEMNENMASYMERAETCFKQALKMDRKANSTHLRNYAFFLQEFKKGGNSVAIADKARTLFFLADKVDSIQDS